MPKLLTEQLIDLFLPVSCVNCALEGNWLCQDCQKLLASNRSVTCALCKKAGVNGICASCKAETKIDGIVSLFSYKDEIVQKLVKSLKYKGYSDIAGFIAKQYGRKIIRQLPEDFIATFPPIDRTRLGKRGFNQSELLANQICGSSLAVFTKIRSTAPQASLGKQERKKNLKKAFSAIKTVPERIVIFDDVITTGSTISELAKIAKRKGATEVWVATIACD